MPLLQVVSIATLSPRLEDITGREFGYLKVIGPTAHKWHRGVVWLCRCRCGRLHPIRAASLKGDGTKSCGCAKGELISQNRARHGMTGRRVWRIWKGMIERCHKPYGKSREAYADRGIRVCRRWRGRYGFDRFLADMGDPGDASKLTLDRKENAHGYTPKNCRWVTMKSQQRNRRNNRLLTHDRRTQPMAAWAEEIGVSLGTLWRRLSRMPVARALTMPLEIHKRPQSQEAPCPTT
jgi:hypothetical protein